VASAGDKMVDRLHIAAAAAAAAAVAPGWEVD